MSALPLRCCADALYHRHRRPQDVRALLPLPAQVSDRVSPQLHHDNAVRRSHEVPRNNPGCWPQQHPPATEPASSSCASKFRFRRRRPLCVCVVLQVHHCGSGPDQPEECGRVLCRDGEELRASLHCHHVQANPRGVHW